MTLSIPLGHISARGTIRLGGEGGCGGGSGGGVVGDWLLVGEQDEN